MAPPPPVSPPGSATASVVSVWLCICLAGWLLDQLCGRGVCLPPHSHRCQQSAPRRHA